MHCPSGHLVRDGSLFCHQCGAAIAIQAKEASGPSRAAASTGLPPSKRGRKRWILVGVVVAVVLVIGGVVVATTQGNTPQWQSQEVAQVAGISQSATQVSQAKNTGQLVLGYGNIMYYLCHCGSYTPTPANDAGMLHGGSGTAAQISAYQNVGVDAVALVDAAKMLVIAVNDDKSQQNADRLLQAGVIVLKNDVAHFNKVVGS